MKKEILQKAQITITIGIVLMLGAPFLLTITGLLPFNSSTASIGDTIGGITAPIASLIGSILVFYALKAQIDANKAIQQQIDRQKREEGKQQTLQYIGQQVDIVRKDIESFSLVYNVGSEFGGSSQYMVKTGLEAISEYVRRLQYFGETEHNGLIHESNPRLAQFYYLLELINQLITKINKERINKRDKMFFLKVIGYEYKTKIRAAFKANEQFRMSNVEPCVNCGKKHTGIPDEIFNLIDTIDENLNKEL